MPVPAILNIKHGSYRVHYAAVIPYRGKAPGIKVHLAKTSKSFPYQQRNKKYESEKEALEACETAFQKLQNLGVANLKYVHEKKNKRFVIQSRVPGGINIHNNESEEHIPKIFHYVTLITTKNDVLLEAQAFKREQDKLKFNKWNISVRDYNVYYDYQKEMTDKDNKLVYLNDVIEFPIEPSINIDEVIATVCNTSIDRIPINNHDLAYLIGLHLVDGSSRITIFYIGENEYAILDYLKDVTFKLGLQYKKHKVIRKEGIQMWNATLTRCVLLTKIE